MANVRVVRRKDAENADGKAPLYAVFSIAGQKVKIHLDLYVKEREWDENRQKIRGVIMSVRDKNLIIDNTLARINEILVTFRLSGEKLTKESFLSRYHNPGPTQSFLKYALRRLDALRPALGFETWRHHKAVLGKLMDYDPDVTFDQMTGDWLRIYAAHLANHHQNAPGTVAKNMAILRAHYNAAMREGLVKSNPFDTFRMPRSEPQVTYLDEEELTQVIKAYKEKKLPEHEHAAVGYWLWMAFTGMHISDMRALRLEQIFGGEIHYERIKTKVKVSVPLSSPALHLLEIFREGRERGYMVRMPSDQWFNRRIKLAMEKIGIRKNISAKSGRHTFATIFYQKTKDIGTLSKLLGHTSVRHTMIYTHILRQQRTSRMSCFDSFM